jgi:hypothetical protein
MAQPPIDFLGFAKEHLFYEAKMFVTARDILFQLDPPEPQMTDSTAISWSKPAYSTSETLSISSIRP